MAKHSIRLILLSMAITALVFCCTGCSSEEGKEPDAESPPAAEIPEAGSQKPVTPVEPDETGPGKPSPASDIPVTEKQSTATMDEKSDVGSMDKALPAEIVLVQKLWETPTKSAVRLMHENHIKVHKIQCTECHHIYEQGKNVWNDSMPAAKCESCHNEPTVKGEKQLPPEDQKKNLKLAFHNNCRGCHKKVKKENPETKAPLKCSECHEKKE